MHADRRVQKKPGFLKKKPNLVGFFLVLLGFLDKQEKNR